MKVYPVIMTEDQFRLFSEVTKDKKVGAGMLATGVGMGVGGHVLANRSLKNYITKTSEGVALCMDAPRDGLFKPFRKANKGEILDSLIESAKGKGSKQAVKTSRKFWGNLGMRAAGVGIGLAGAGKLTYDYLKKKNK